MVNDQSALDKEQLAWVARIIEDVAKIHELYEEIDRLPIPQEIRVQLDMLIETMEMLNLLKMSNKIKDIPMDYENTYTKIKRGIAYVKRGEEWVRLGFVNDQKTIEKLIGLRREIVMDVVGVFEIMAMDEKEIEQLEREETEEKGEKEEILELHKRLKIDKRTLAIILRNVSERLLFNEQDQCEGLEAMYLRIKEKIEREYQKNPEEFGLDIDREIKKADENYQKYLSIKKNRDYEEKLREAIAIKDKNPEDLEMYLWVLYDTMPPYFTDPNGLIGKIFGREQEKEGDPMAALEAALREFAKSKSEIEEKIMQKLNENKQRAKSTFYGYFEEREKQKAEEQARIIENIGGEELAEKLKGAVEDMVVMRRLKKQIERMRLSDETKMRFASIAETMELLHMIKTGIINQEHKGDFYEIRDGVVYLKNPEVKFWNSSDMEIRLGRVIEDRDIIINGINSQRAWAFRSIIENVKKDIASMDSGEIAELLEVVGRRLVFNQQDQHLGAIKLAEVVWSEFEERYKEEKAKLYSAPEGEEKKKLLDEFALKSDRIAGYIGKTIKYIENMKTNNKEAIKIGKALTDRMYPFYLTAKEANIARIRGENEIYEGEVDVYLTPVKNVHESIPRFVSEIENGGDGPSEEELVKLLKEIEEVDPDKVLLKGARDKAFPLLPEMEKIIRMVESDRYDEKKKDKLEKLFEIAAVQISKFAIRFQIPLVLKEGGKVTPLNYGESLFMVQGLLRFLGILEKWGKIRAPYFEYMLETVRAVERISQETLCPNIKEIAWARYTVETLERIAMGEEGETKKQIAEIIGYIANRAMVIDLELENKGERLSKEDQLNLYIILYTASTYTGSDEYREYADKKYKDPVIHIIEYLKNRPKDIDLTLDLLETWLERKSPEKEMKVPGWREFYFGNVLKKFEELKEAVKNKWKEDKLKRLDEIIEKVKSAINEGDKQEMKGAAGFGRGSVNFAGAEEIGIGKIRRWGIKI
jgi:hypothetical protein